MTVRPPGATSILQAVEKRGETDTQPSYYVHVVLPFILALAAVLITAIVATLQSWQIGVSPAEGASVGFGTIAAVILLALLVILAAVVLMFRGWYLLIQRRNDHLARDRILRQGLLDYTRRIAETHTSETSGDHLRSMERLHNDALMEENERPAPVHLLLYVLTGGLWGLYVLYFLLKDFPHHSQRQSRFVREARGVFDVSDLDPDTVPTLDPIPEHSYLASLALWILVPVVGPFIVTWWLYEDPVDHFEAQRVHEDALVDLVQDADAVEPPAPSPTHEPSAEEGPDADEDSEAAGEDEEATEHTIWQCSECDAKYKVPPKRPVRVTCKNCGNKEVLEE